MVVKYAMSEKSVITVKKDLELAERRLREANKARDLLSDRLKTVQSEKEKANNLLETKVCIHPNFRFTVLHTPHFVMSFYQSLFYQFLGTRVQYCQ